MALARLAALDRRLPFGTATLVAATAGGVLALGSTVAVLRDPSPGSVVAAPEASAGPRASATPKPGKPAKPEKPAKPDDPGDYLLDVGTVVPGFRKMGDRVAGAGPMDLEDAAVIEAGGEKPTEEDRDALRDLGFVRGHSRAWSNGEVHVVVLAYEWKDAEGPLTFVKGVEYVSAERGDGWKPPMNRAAGVCATRDGHTDDTISAAVGKHSFLVIVRRDGGCKRHELVAKIALALTKHAARLGA